MKDRNSSKDLANDSQSQFDGHKSVNKTRSVSRKKKPKFSDLGVLKRNQDWLKAKERKLKFERDKKKYHEIDGCTFEPHVNKFNLKTSENKLSARSSSLNISNSARTNRSYSDIHKNRIPKPSLTNQSYRSSKPNDTIISENFKITD